MHVRPNTIARACFLIIEQVCSLAERLQEAYMYVAGFSSPSSEACDKTAPKPYDEALTYDIKRLPSRFRNITPSYSIMIKLIDSTTVLVYVTPVRFKKQWRNKMNSGSRSQIMT